MKTEKKKENNHNTCNNNEQLPMLIINTNSIFEVSDVIPYPTSIFNDFQVTISCKDCCRLFIVKRTKLININPKL